MKHAVLFVDDDFNLIQGLRRSLHQLSREWDLFFCNSASEALQILQAHRVDLIVTDMRMPGLGGAELLEIVEGLYPHIIRFVLSGQTDQEIALISSRLAHQFFAKPCDAAQLVEAIQRALDMQFLLPGNQLTAVIASSKHLPSLPSLYFRLVREIESPNASARSIGEIVSQDITMTAKVLQLVNSAFYGLPSKVTSVQMAVAYLGMSTLKALVLYQPIFFRVPWLCGVNAFVG